VKDDQSGTKRVFVSVGFVYVMEVSASVCHMVLMEGKALQE
jgi:hypothetical protein